MKIISGKGLSSRQKTKNKKSNSTHSKSKFSPNRKPELMSLTEWQTALRRQAAETEYLQVRAVDRGSESDNTDSGAELISKGLEFLGGLAKAIATRKHAGNWSTPSSKKIRRQAEPPSQFPSAAKRP